MPFALFMFKEVTVKASMAYNDDDFSETVAAFCSGMSSTQNDDKKLISR